MNTPPLISIIIPIYNVEDYLGKCIESCLSQSYPNFEVIAVNDGSTDKSSEILEQYSINEKRLIVIHQENSGVVAARNKAISCSNGEYLFFVDGDDYISTNALEQLYIKLVETNADIVIGGMGYDRQGKFFPLQNSLPYGEEPINVLEAMLTEKQQFSLSPKLIPKCRFNNIDTPNLKIGEDAYIVIQLINRVNKVTIVDSPIYFYVSRTSSITNNPNSEAIKSSLHFILLVEEYMLKHKKSEDVFFRNCLSYFMLNQFFSYLRMGGNYDANIQLKERINNIYMNDWVAVNWLPIWRRFLLKSYMYSPRFGHLIRFVFNKIRLLLR